MHKHYIINGSVEFHPAASTLRDLNHPDCVVVLNSPAGRCLLLLIERAGSIVTQQEFLESVWLQRGMLVSSNTYYQNISILRKGLKKIGFATDPIVTVPRIGLTLSSEMQIVIKDVPPPQSILKSDHVRSARLSTRPLWLAILMVQAGVSLIRYGDARGNHFIDDYRFVTQLAECHIYLENEVQTQPERESALAYVGQFAEDCARYPWVYIARYSMLPRTSVIRCDRPMVETNSCISDYFIEERWHGV
ncbi:MAG TPA: winged helix-turn-helix domain-containing protein [Enterobacteriaceae bacterium]|nr:winged helix-turn-helix domain-containing protein [Enterobacteriaceae bacterium]